MEGGNEATNGSVITQFAEGEQNAYSLFPIPSTAFSDKINSNSPALLR